MDIIINLHEIGGINICKENRIDYFQYSIFCHLTTSKMTRFFSATY
jgi:hypothetical protein